MQDRATFGIDAGEPAGIGPDLALAVWRRRAELDLPPFYIVADPGFLRRSCKAWTRRSDRHRDAAIGYRNFSFWRFRSCRWMSRSLPNPADRMNQARPPPWLQFAVRSPTYARARQPPSSPIRSPRTCSIDSGFAEPGHTEFLATLVQEATGKALRPVMMLWSPELAVVPVTIHLPLREHLRASFERPHRRDRAHRRARSCHAFSHPAAAAGDRRAQSACRRKRRARRGRSHDRRAGGRATRRRGHRRARARCRPIRCFMSARARATTPHCACTTIRR